MGLRRPAYGVNGASSKRIGDSPFRLTRVVADSLSKYALQVFVKRTGNSGDPFVRVKRPWLTLPVADNAPVVSSPERRCRSTPRTQPRHDTLSLIPECRRYESPLLRHPGQKHRPRTRRVRSPFWSFSKSKYKQAMNVVFRVPTRAPACYGACLEGSRTCHPVCPRLQILSLITFITSVFWT